MGVETKEDKLMEGTMETTETQELNQSEMTDEELDKAAVELRKAETELEASLSSEAGGTKETPPPTLEDLTARIAETEKANQGMYETMKAERIQRQEAEQKSQELEARLQGITEVFGQTVENRRSGQSTSTELPAPEGKLNLDIDDEGNASIPIDALKSILKDHGLGETQAELQALRNHLMQSDVETARETEFSGMVDRIVAEDPGYAPVYGQLVQAQAWFNDEIIEYQKQHKLTGVMATGEALDIVNEPGLNGKSIEDQFISKFPALDMDKIVRCYDSKRDLRTALKSLSGNNQQQTIPFQGKKAADNLRNVAGKPSNLGGMRNQKGSSTGMNLDDIANLPPGEIENMTDEQVEALHRHMAREEDTA